MAVDLFATQKTKTPEFRNSFAADANVFDVGDDQDMFKQPDLGTGGTRQEREQGLFKALGGDAVGAVQQQLAGQAPGFETQANIAREQQKTQQEQVEGAQREALFGAGLANTGQRFRFEMASPQQQARERQDLERRIASEGARLGAEQRQAGIQSATNLMGLAQQGGLSEQQIEQTGELFYADLDQQDQELAQQAEQFTSKLDFDKWAVQAGIDDNKAARIWQATQNEKDRAITTNIATMQNDTHQTHPCLLYTSDAADE